MLTTGFVTASGDGDAWRSPHPRAEGTEDLPPAGICESCSHQALRHSRLECRFHELDPRKYKPCQCRGMRFRSEVFEIDPAHGPIRRLSDRPAPL